MAWQKMPGQGLWVPEIYRGAGTFSTGGLIDATGEKAAFCGAVFTGGGAKNITKVHFRFGAVTKAGGSGLTLSLQDVLLTSGSIMVPDETQDQTEAIANGDANFASNTWHPGAALSATRTVSTGDLLAIVLEYDGGGRLGADSVVLSSHTWNDAWVLQSACVEKSGAGPAWVAQASRTPDVVLEFDDGTFGTLEGCWPASALSNVAFKQNTAGSDEYAMALSFPFPVKVDAFWMRVNLGANTADCSVILYDGTSAMTNGTVAIDANSVLQVATQALLIRNFPDEIALAANHTYYLSLQPTQTVSNDTLYYADVAANGHMQALGGGAGWNLTSRLDLGAWAAVTNTRRPLMGLRVSSCDDATGSGGAGDQGGGMQGLGMSNDWNVTLWR